MKSLMCVLCIMSLAQNNATQLRCACVYTTGWTLPLVHITITLTLIIIILCACAFSALYLHSCI